MASSKTPLLSATDSPGIGAGEDVEDSLGEARLLGEVHDGDGGERRVPRRLHHARAAGRDGRTNLERQHEISKNSVCNYQTSLFW